MSHIEFAVLRYARIITIVSDAHRWRWCSSWGPSRLKGGLSPTLKEAFEAASRALESLLADPECLDCKPDPVDLKEERREDYVRLTGKKPRGYKERDNAE